MNTDQIAERRRQNARLLAKGLPPQPICCGKQPKPQPSSPKSEWVKRALECACGAKPVAWFRDGTCKCEQCLNRDTARMRRFMR